MQKNLTIQTNSTIREAMETLDKTAERVLLVVDEDFVLIGTLTDGDIRRYILKGNDITDNIVKVYNPNPAFAFQEDFDLEKIKSMLLEKRLELIPIVDQERRVVDYITWEKALEDDRKSGRQKLDAAVVIMAGGKGTRLEPFTKVLPKPLIPVGDKTIIDHIIDSFRDYGVLKFYITVHHMSKIMRAYFDEKKSDYLVDFVEEDEPRGTAGSLKLLQDRLDSPFFVSNCDIIVKVDYVDLYRFHTKYGYDITLIASTKQFHIPYGICELNGNGSLERIQEKPEYNFLANTGLYVLSPHVLDFIPNDGLFHITRLIEKVIENGGEVGVYPVSETAWTDVGQWAEYGKALRAIESLYG